MMIGDDDVDRERVGVLHHFIGADAGIDADDELDAALGGFLHHFAFHAIAIEDAMRNVTRGLASGEFDGGFQNDQSAGAVDVVVAIKKNALAIPDGQRQALGRARHIGEQKGIVQIGRCGREKLARACGIAITARHQHASRQR